MNHPAIHPLGRRLFLHVRKPEKEEKIFIPDGFMQDSILHGEVIAIGSKCEDFQGNIGDTVAINDYTGNTIKFQGEELKNYLLIDERNILGILCQSNMKQCEINLSKVE